MARRLTTFSKLLITFIIIAVLYLGCNYVVKNTQFGQDLLEKSGQTVESETGNNANNGTNKTNKSASTKNNSTNSGSKSTNNSSRGKDDNTLRVQLVTWGGYAPGLYFNEGAEANLRSRFYKDYGFKVDFKLENDLINAMNAWIADEYDVIVQTADAFPLYTAPDEINRYEPKAFMQVDWSRGGDAIIVKRGINTVNDLKGKKIAVAVPSPAQTLLSYSLDAAGLSYDDVKVVKTSDNLKAAELFRTNEIDAAVVWSPDDILATRDVAGSKILLTTKDQSHIIADILFAKESVIQEKKDMINGFYEGWMKGVAEMQNPANHDKAAKYLAELNGVGVEDAKGMMQTVYWTNHGDNQNFFGLNSGYKGQKGQDLYSRMAQVFTETGDAEKVAPNWRSVVYTGAVQAANLKGNDFNPEKPKVFKAPTAAEKTAPPVASKPISISFSTGQYQLTENAKTIIDIQFSEIAKSFANMKVRVEGNTDNVGNRVMNMQLSQKRAKAVADYLQTQYGMDRNRFVVLGNGPDKPVSGCEQNQNETCKSKNRRTEFQLISVN